ncbi:MAG: hypothetical protein WAN11_06650 [Syntrophobacteraceae bacterium]
MTDPAQRAVGPPARIATACGGGRQGRTPRGAWRLLCGGKGRIDLDALPDLSTTRGGTHVRLRATP